MSKNMVGRFVVVATDSSELGGEISGDVLNVGSFETQEEAETWLREDSAKAFAGGDDTFAVGEHKDFGTVHVICEVKRVVLPVTMVKVEARLQDL